MTRMSEIPAEILAEMTPAVRAFVESLLLQMAAMQDEIDELKSQVTDLKSQLKRLTPQSVGCVATHRANRRSTIRKWCVPTHPTRLEVAAGERTPVVHGRIPDEANQPESLAVDGRGVELRRVCRLRQSCGNRSAETSRGAVRGNHPLRPGEDVLAGPAAAMVLGASEAGHPGVDRASRSAGETTGARSATPGRNPVRPLARIQIGFALVGEIPVGDETGPGRGGWSVAARGVQRA